MNYLEWVRYVWDDIRKWWPSLSETNQKRGMDAINILKRVVPFIQEDKPEERQDAFEAVLQAITTLQEMHTLKVVSGTKESGYYFAPSELANFQQSLSFNNFMFNVSLYKEESVLLEAIIHQSEKSSSTYALLRQLKVMAPECTFIWPLENPLQGVARQKLLDSLSTKHFIRTDKSNTLGLNIYVRPTLGGLLRMKTKEGRRS